MMAIFLLTGRWTSSLCRNINKTISAPVPDSVVLGRKITFCDTSLVDGCGVDIELPGRRAVIVQSLSSWAADGKETRAFITTLIRLASTERYESVHCILCIQGGLSPSQAKQVLQVQNASFESPTQVQVQLSSVIALSCVIAEATLRSLTRVDLTQYQQAVQQMANDAVVSRATFLVRLIPTLSAFDAIKCLTNGNHSNPVDQLQQLLCSEIARQRMSANLPSQKPMSQLSHILRANLK